jgi:hypothetical protein
MGGRRHHVEPIPFQSISSGWALYSTSNCVLLYSAKVGTLRNKDAVLQDFFQVIPKCQVRYSVTPQKSIYLRNRVYETYKEPMRHFRTIALTLFQIQNLIGRTRSHSAVFVPSSFMQLL